jgi:hypothetical protein
MHTFDHIGVGFHTAHMYTAQPMRSGALNVSALGRWLPATLLPPLFVVSAITIAAPHLSFDAFVSSDRAPALAALAAPLTMAAALAPKLAPRTRHPAADRPAGAAAALGASELSASEAGASEAGASEVGASEVGAKEKGADASRADASLNRARHSSVKGGVLFVPSTFASSDGSYDLLVHFHGNTAVVRESAEVAGLNAIVVVINVGVGSLPYQQAYEVPGSYEALLDQVHRALKRRGLERAKLRRVALSSWSAGYGALARLLPVRKGIDPLDAILVTEGIHASYLEEDDTQLNPRAMAPFTDAARAAARGDILFSITHTDVDPPSYAGTKVTADYLLQIVGAARFPRYDDEAYVNIVAAKGAVAKRKEKRMRAQSEARLGGLHVRGYGGETPEHHMAHLLHMGATVLPELATRWKE